ncbi:MAG: hypothetical protein IT381_19035 [Deltaproteobacteria bacterium]|nr:hypothetical protein [Deltaproteobacteria bacterium]
MRVGNTFTTTDSEHPMIRLLIHDYGMPTAIVAVVGVYLVRLAIQRFAEGSADKSRDDERTLIARFDQWLARLSRGEAILFWSLVAVVGLIVVGVCLAVWA